MIELSLLTWVSLRSASAYEGTRCCSYCFCVVLMLVVMVLMVMALMVMVL
jgi:hypothetical protein